MSKVLIIGGGVAGLSAGINCLKSGHEVTICEQHTVAGGNLTGWNRRGYHIDNCIHWLTGTNPHSAEYPMWKELGALGNVDIIQQDTLFTVEHEGHTVSLYRDIDKTQEELLRECPEDKKEINTFIRAVKTVMGIEGFLGKNKDQKGTFGGLLKGIPSLLHYVFHTTQDIADRCKTELMKRFFVAICSEYFTAIAFIYVSDTFCGDNGGLPAGGSLKMANRMVEKFTSMGGTLLLKKKAEKVNLEGNVATSVRFTDGDTIAADQIVLCMDPKMAIGRLVDTEMPRSLRSQYKDKTRKRFSSFHSAFAVDAKAIPFVGTLIIDIPEKFRSVLGGKQVVLREFSHEQGFSPEGKNIIQTMIFCGESACRKIIEKAKDRKAYLEEKLQIKEALTEMLEEKFESLKGKLDCLDIWTPASYARYIGSEVGSYMTFVIPKFRIPKHTRSRFKKIKNLYFATQWQQSPGGLPIAAMMGMSAAKAIG